MLAHPNRERKNNKRYFEKRIRKYKPVKNDGKLKAIQKQRAKQRRNREKDKY
jgi:hypothetical protein